MKEIPLLILLCCFLVLGCSHEEKKVSKDEKTTEVESKFVKDRNGEVVEIHSPPSNQIWIKGTFSQIIHLHQIGHPLYPQLFQAYPLHLK